VITGPWGFSGPAINLQPNACDWQFLFLTSVGISKEAPARDADAAGELRGPLV
jgi:hypothetical protein